MKRGGWLKRRQPLRAMSARRGATLERRREAVAVAMRRAFHTCEADFVPDVACAGPLDGHEPLTRAHGGDPTDPNNIIILCRAHHDWTHGHPREATALGLLKSPYIA